MDMYFSVFRCEDRGRYFACALSAIFLRQFFSGVSPVCRAGAIGGGRDLPVRKYIGGQVDPVIPAVAAFILWSWRRTDGIRFRTGGKL